MGTTPHIQRINRIGCASYYRARYYDPTTGRFLREDSASFYGGLNFYRYAANDPLNSIDPFGMQRLKECQQNCQKAAQSKLRVKLRSITGNNKDGDITYDLTGTDGQSFVVFQAESNPSRAVSTPYGPVELWRNDKHVH